ncbi:ABC transporter substrate-binding protein [Klebsiella sp. BIGb0407]|uniref:ABC transporter substrate-binding protein n=1 Tax=Klebsiella sp. BIGb0407 TaxID=2940603 RepID=UPI00216A93A0|nr:ABC transporter substrate-binding protein [Klebsiella sp. BIGb0407]MCS3432176.1 iron complex transport system substrate-binding protein [Klebsiella sp. BIGb0407]
MEITRRKLIGYLLSGAVLSVSPFATRAASTLLAPFGTLPSPQKTHRILSAGAPADLLLLALAPEMLLGLSSFDLSHSDDDFLSESIRRLPKLGRLSGRASTLSLEKIVSLAPDIIIDCGSADETFRSLAQRTAAQTGIPYLLVDGGLRDSASQLRQVGERLGVSARAEKQAQLAERFLQDAENFAKQNTHPLRFYSARGATGLETGLQGSLHTEAAELLGLTNVASDSSQHGLAQVSFEQLLLWDPDIILTQDPRTYRYITQNALWKNLQAVRNGQVFCFSGLPFGWLDSPPGINRLSGMRRLQSYFDTTAQATWLDDLQQFFQLFYHSDLSHAQLQRLLEAE